MHGNHNRNLDHRCIQASSQEGRALALLGAHTLVGGKTGYKMQKFTPLHSLRSRDLYVAMSRIVRQSIPESLNFLAYLDTSSGIQNAKIHPVA